MERADRERRRCSCRQGPSSAKEAFFGLVRRLHRLPIMQTGVRRGSNMAYHRGMIRYRSTCLRVAALVSACAALAEETLETILAEPLPAEAYVAPVRCVNTGTYRRIEVLDENMLLMRGPGNRSWVAQTRQRCRGLRDEHLLDFQRRRGRICKGDSFRGVVPATERIVVTPVCGIGVIYQVDNDQITTLVHAIRAKRYTGNILRSTDNKTATKK